MALQHRSSFWQRCEQVAATHADVLKNIAARLPEGGAAHLRGTSRCVREALNRVVHTVRWTPGAPYEGVEMATVFPEAELLEISAMNPFDVDDIVGSSPVLLQKIRHLKLAINEFPTEPSDVSEVARLLSMCAPLQYTFRQLIRGGSVIACLAVAQCVEFPAARKWSMLRPLSRWRSEKQITVQLALHYQYHTTTHHPSSRPHHQECGGWDPTPQPQLCRPVLAPCMPHNQSLPAAHLSARKALKRTR
jgi:hypothetical protein